MGSRRPQSAPRWQVILEEMRPENRATLEAVLTLQRTFEARMDRTDVDAVIRIEDRVAALEKRAFGPGGGSTPAPA